jgi:hypothetical protein
MMMFYTDHHHWSVAEITVLEKVLRNQWPGWLAKYAHRGLSDLLGYMGIENSALCDYPENIGWSSPQDTIADHRMTQERLIWITRVDKSGACVDHCYLYRWDALLGLLTRGPSLIKELEAAPPTRIPDPGNVVGGAVIDATRRLTVWPDSPEFRLLVPAAWRGWNVEYYSQVDGWSHHATRTGRSASAQRINWPDLVRAIGSALNDCWRKEQMIDLDKLVELQSAWVRQMHSGIAPALSVSGTAETDAIAHHLAHLMALIELVE